MSEPKAHNDFECLKCDYGIFSMHEGQLRMEMSKNGSASQELVDAYKAAAKRAAEAIIVCEGQPFLIMYSDQANQLIASVRAKCAKLGINL